MKLPNINLRFLFAGFIIFFDIMKVKSVYIKKFENPKNPSRIYFLKKHKLERTILYRVKYLIQVVSFSFSLVELA